MKGVQFIFETCRSLYAYALKRRHLPPYAGNPFSELPLERLKIEDAKAIFVFTADTELAFLRRCSEWAFPVHFTLAKTGLRVGELTHLLVEDLDLDGGWPHVRNKTELGWRVKTGQERLVPLLPEVVAVLRAVVGTRRAGPVFLRERLNRKRVVLSGDRRELELGLRERRATLDEPPTRGGEAALARTVWLGRRGGEAGSGAAVVRPGDRRHRPPRVHLPEVVAAHVRHPAPGRERGPADPPAGDGAQANPPGRARHDRELHPHPAGDPQGAG